MGKDVYVDGVQERDFMKPKERGSQNSKSENN